MAVIAISDVISPLPCNDDVYPIDDPCDSTSFKFMSMIAVIQGLVLGYNYAAFYYFPLNGFYILTAIRKGIGNGVRYDMLISIIVFIIYYFINPVKPFMVHYYGVPLIILTVATSIVSIFMPTLHFVALLFLTLCKIIVDMGEFSAMGVYAFAARNNIVQLYVGKCAGLFISTFFMSFLAMDIITNKCEDYIHTFIFPISVVLVNLLNLIFLKCIKCTKDYRYFFKSRNFCDIVKAKCSMPIGFEGYHYIKKDILLYILSYFVFSLTPQPFVYEPLPEFRLFFPFVLLKNIGDLLGGLTVALLNTSSSPVTNLFIVKVVVWIIFMGILSFAAIMIGSNAICFLLLLVCFVITCHAMSYATATALKYNIDDASKTLSKDSTVSTSMFGILIMKVVCRLCSFVYFYIATVLISRFG